VRRVLHECVDFSLVRALRQAGHDVAYVTNIAPRASGLGVMQLAEYEARLPLTGEKDFGGLVFRQARPVPGVVLIRIDPTHRARKAERLMAAIDRFGAGLLGRYTVIEGARFRSRPLRIA
jgi:hypothetical protein